MTKREARRLLTSVKLKETMIAERREAKARLREVFYGDLAPKMMPKMTSSNPKKIQTVYAKLAEMERQIDKEIEDYLKMELECNRRFQKMEKTMEVLVLRKFFLTGETVKAIAMELEKSERWVYQFIESGLNSFGEA